MCCFKSSTLSSFSETVFCTTSKDPRLPCRQWIMLHYIVLMENGKDLSVDWILDQAFSLSHFIFDTRSPMAGSSKLWRDSHQDAHPLQPSLCVLLMMEDGNIPCSWTPRYGGLCPCHHQRDAKNQLLSQRHTWIRVTQDKGTLAARKSAPNPVVQ